MTSANAPIRLRPAERTDTDVLYRFLCELEGETLDRPAFNAVLTENLTNPRIRYVMAERGNIAVGFGSVYAQALLHHAALVAEIQEMFVLPAERSAGLGAQLVAALEAAARQMGCRQIEVTTNRQRSRAIHFYEQAGFVVSHVKLVKILRA